MSEPAERSELSVRPWRTWRMRWPVLGLLVGLWAAVLLTLYTLMQDVGYARKHISENFSHLSSQVYYELSAVIDRLDRLRLGDPEVDVETVTQRFDIFLGRVETLSAGEVGRSYAEVEGANVVLAAARVTLLDLAPSFERLRADDVAEIERLKAALRELVPGIHRVTLRSMQQQATHRTALIEVRDRLRGWFLIWLAASLLLSAAAVSLLLSERRRLRRFAQRLTERNRRQSEDLLRAESLFRATVAASPAAISVRDTEGRALLVNPAWAHDHGAAEADVVGEQLIAAPNAVAPRRRQAVADTVLVSGEPEEHVFDQTIEGRRQTLHVTTFPVLDPDGKVIGVGEIAADVTAEREAEERLGQAQKLESIGRLTGNVAHDFNNLLTIIQGNVDLLQYQASMDPESLQAIRKATERGAELTRGLLAFGRRQSLRPRPTDVGALVDDMSGLLTTTLGGSVELEVQLAANLWHASVDPGQLEGALINLAINARDAMPEGGRLFVSVSNVAIDPDRSGAAAGSAGEYIVIRVEDTGTGMADGVKAQAFEPFFTTKPVGAGSGLGLSMVYGFANQSGGWAVIDSQPGRGTAVSLYLRRTRAVDADRSASVSDEARTGHGELVLVLEDEQGVLVVVESMLCQLGYRVVPVDSVAAARAWLDEAETPPAVLLTDLVLPGTTSGMAFAEEFAERHPEAAVVRMSGYPGLGGAQADVDNDEPVLMKPFTRQALARALRSALDAGGETSPARVARG